MTANLLLSNIFFVNLNHSPKFNINSKTQSKNFYSVEFKEENFNETNGRVGRLIMFKECLKNNIVPFIIDDNSKMLYLRGLSERNNEKGFLTDTCLTAQDKFKKYLEYFKVPYEE